MTLPARILRDTENANCMSLVHSADVREYVVAFASSTASSTVSTTAIVNTIIED